MEDSEEKEEVDKEELYIINFDRNGETRARMYI